MHIVCVSVFFRSFFLFFHFVAFVPQLHLAHVTRNCVRDYGNLCVQHTRARISLLFLYSNLLFFSLCQYYFVPMELNSYDAPFSPFNTVSLSLMHTHTHSASIRVFFCVRWVTLARTHKHDIIIIITNVCAALC